jgi:hypothetical protein
VIDLSGPLPQLQVVDLVESPELSIVGTIAEAEQVQPTLTA